MVDSSDSCETSVRTAPSAAEENPGFSAAVGLCGERSLSAPLETSEPQWGMGFDPGGAGPARLDKAVSSLEPVLNGMELD